MTVIKILEEQSKNIWVPPPLYTKEIQIQPKEIISYDKSELKIKFTIKRIDNINDSLNLIIFLEVNQEKKLKKNVELKGPNSNEEWIWILSAEEWMNIDNNINNFILIIKIDKFQIFTNQNPTLISDISYIKNGKGKTFNHQITDNGIKKISISITPILPEGDKSIIMEEKEILSLKKLYTPFEPKSNNDKNKNKNKNKNELMKKPSQLEFNVKRNETKP